VGEKGKQTQRGGKGEFGGGWLGPRFGWGVKSGKPPTKGGFGVPLPTGGALQGKKKWAGPFKPEKQNLPPGKRGGAPTKKTPNQQTHGCVWLGKGCLWGGWGLTPWVSPSPKNPVSSVTIPQQTEKKENIETGGSPKKKKKIGGKKNRNLRGSFGEAEVFFAQGTPNVSDCRGKVVFKNWTPGWVTPPPSNTGKKSVEKRGQFRCGETRGNTAHKEKKKGVPPKGGVGLTGGGVLHNEYDGPRGGKNVGGGQGKNTN